jgi:acyl carrier protein
LSTDIEQRILKLAAEQVGFDLDKVKPETKLVADLGYDSLDLVEFIMQIEDEFAIEIPDDDCNDIVDLNQVIQYVSGKVRT